MYRGNEHTEDIITLCVAIQLRPGGGEDFQPERARNIGLVVLRFK